jgi:hypothetical protein
MIKGIIVLDNDGKRLLAKVSKFADHKIDQVIRLECFRLIIADGTDLHTSIPFALAMLS